MLSPLRVRVVAVHASAVRARRPRCLLQTHDRAMDATHKCGLWSVPRMRQVCSVIGEARPAGTEPPASSDS